MMSKAARKPRAFHMSILNMTLLSVSIETVYWNRDIVEKESLSDIEFYMINSYCEMKGEMTYALTL